MQRNIDLIFNALLFSFFLLLLFLALQYGREAQAVPLIVIIPGLGLTLARIIVNVYTSSAGQKKRSPAADQPDDKMPIDGRRLLSMLLWVMALPLTIWLLGFNTGCPLFVLIFLLTHGEKWPFSLGMAIATALVIYFVFSVAMKLSLYPGEFFIFLTKHGIYMPF